MVSSKSYILYRMILYHILHKFVNGALRASTNHGGLPGGVAAGMPRRRFDVKVEIQGTKPCLDLPIPIDLRQTPLRPSNLRFRQAP